MHTMPAVHLSGIKVIAFDLDDTLFSERQYAFSGFDAVANWLRSRVNCPFDPAARMRELFTTADRRRVFDQVLAELSLPEPAGLIQQMIACYRAHRPTIGLYPDAAVVLGRWANRFGLALLSDGPVEMQRAKVDALALKDRLHPVVLTGEWGEQYWKPHLRGFRAIEEALGAGGSSCLYIADNPSKDFVGPKKLGWRTVQVCRPEGIYCDLAPAPGGEPEYQIRSLLELEPTP
jgi:putative hydrolase of the HAD superfamily